MISGIIKVEVSVITTMDNNNDNNDNNYRYLGYSGYHKTDFFEESNDKHTITKSIA